jgi:hypothetical protein
MSKPTKSRCASFFLSSIFALSFVPTTVLAQGHSETADDVQMFSEAKLTML